MPFGTATLLEGVEKLPTATGTARISVLLSPCSVHFLGEARTSWCCCCDLAIILLWQLYPVDALLVDCDNKSIGGWCIHHFYYSLEGFLHLDGVGCWYVEPRCVVDVTIGFKGGLRFFGELWLMHPSSSLVHSAGG